MKKTIPRHIIINLLKSSEKKRKIFKAGRGNNDGLNTQGIETDDSRFLVRNNAKSSHNSYIFKILKNRVAN